jgi:hypothetical protein
MTEWMDNDEKFRDRAKKGFAAERAMAKRFEEAGVPAVLKPQKIRPHVSKRKKYGGGKQTDLMVGWKPHRVEVKCRLDMTFTGVDDYTFDPVFVETTRSWNAKLQFGLPLATLIVSKDHQGIIAIPTSTRDEWKEVRKFDAARDFYDEWFACPKRLCRTFEELCDWLKEKG